MKTTLFIYRNSSNRKIVYACQTVLCSFSLKCVQLPSLSCRNCDSFRSKLEEKVQTLIFVANNRVTSPVLSVYSLDVCFKVLFKLDYEQSLLSGEVRRASQKKLVEKKLMCFFFLFRFLTCTRNPPKRRD